MRRGVSCLILPAIPLAAFLLPGCPQENGGDRAAPPTSNLPSGVYTGNVSAHVLETDGAVVVTDETMPVPLTVIINETGQVVTPVTGRVFRVGEPVGVEAGVLEIEITPTGITAGDGVVVVAGTVQGSVLGYPATGTFVFNYRSLDSDTIEFTGEYILATMDVVHEIFVTYEGTVSK